MMQIGDNINLKDVSGIPTEPKLYIRFFTHFNNNKNTTTYLIPPFFHIIFFERD